MTRAEVRRRGRLGAVVTLLLAGALTGCSDASSGAGRAAPAPDPVIESYVALGDSFTAAPFVPITDFAGGCLRSSGNYPALLAEELDVPVDDVSCSGADTADMTGAQSAHGRKEWYGKVRPQLDALRRGTDLVTLGIGGNDEQLFQTLVSGCTSVSDEAGSPCSAVLRETFGDSTKVLAEVGRRVTGVLDAIQRKAPDAVVVLVGYPRLVDADRGCPAIPLADADRPVVAKLEGQLNRALAGAARKAGAEYVDMYAASEGHAICSNDPWVNGKVTDQQRALAFHPFAEEQQAVADEILALL